MARSQGLLGNNLHVLSVPVGKNPIQPKSNLRRSRLAIKGNNAEKGTAERIHAFDGNILVSVDEMRDRATGKALQGFLCHTLKYVFWLDAHLEFSA
jgi:hypothetical protein